jgi:hypothetical protein
MERIVSAVRAELASTFERQAAEVAQRTAAEKDAAVRQATDAARKESQAQLEQVRRDAQAEIDAAKRDARAQIDAAKRDAQGDIDAAKRAAHAESAARVRAEAQVEDVRRIGRAQVEEAQRLMSDRVSAITRELEESRREIAVRRTELDTARGASAAALTDLVRGIHAVDEAESLTAVLHRLIEAAQPHSKGASVLLVQNDDLREWATAETFGRARLTERGLAVASNSAKERRRVESEMAIAFPVTVGGEVVAVLYAEVDDALSPQRRISKDALDTLTRHAGRMLETITVQQAAGLRPLRRQVAPVRSGLSMGER